MLHYDDMLTGCNPIVAITCYTGWTLVKPLSLQNSGKSVSAGDVSKLRETP
jgi:hypothetical protein